MAKYMIWFPGRAMAIPEGEFQQVVDDSHAVIEQAKQAGVYVFGGGLDESVEPMLVDADGGVSADSYPETSAFKGGLTILELPSEDAAIEWAARIARACRCPQELRVFQFDPAS